jgi:hypothetical protein
MTNINRLYATALLIKGALFPARAHNSSPPPADSAITHIFPQDYAATLAAITDLLRADGTLSLHFAGALFPAGPFLLYRLKAAGFSGCKAVVTSEGILLTARR